MKYPVEVLDPYDDDGTVVKNVEELADACRTALQTSEDVVTTDG
mgnify:CR=1 FL=1